MIASFLKSRLAWWLIFIASLAPFILLVSQVLVGADLGPDPATHVLEYLAVAALVMLLITLSLSPLKTVTSLGGWLRYRRMLGLYALFYAALHVAVFWLLVAGDDIVNDLLKRPYIAVGFTAFLILVVLGLTSFKRAVRRLGKRWKKLHRLVYLAAILAVVHVFWQVRSDYAEAALYALILLLLLAVRVPRIRRLFRA